MQKKERKWGSRVLAKQFGRWLASCLAVGIVLLLGGPGSTVYAAETITSMDYFSANDGPTISGSGVGQASYGFVMPVFNEGADTWEDVASDLKVYVLVDQVWTDIDNVSSFVYNQNWGNWSDGGFHGYWFTLSQTTDIRLSSIANPNVTLDYSLVFNALSEVTITSMTATQGPTLTAGVTGSIGFTYPSFNGDSTITYEQVTEDLEVLVWSNESQEWIALYNNAESGWIYDQNFGAFTEGGGGLWFTLSENTMVRLRSISSPSVYLDYTLQIYAPVRTNYVLSADVTTYAAGDTGAIGIPLPAIDGGNPVSGELGNYVYEINVDGQWVALNDSSLSGFSYQGNGYNNMSAANQWGYWVDGIYGLWFQPIQEDMQLRIGYPQNGIQGGAIGSNYITYTFTGNPNAYRPDASAYEDIELGTSGDSAISGWNLIWNDEFTGTSLNTNKWNYETGYYINGDPSMWGWGNAELEYYTDSEDNVYVEDGHLHLKAYYDPTTFPEIDPNRTAEYSSGKITTKDKFAFKYGRIDFSAKLPGGTALWPACWMLPNDDVYGGWASSGEIDVMEARGRLTGSTSGTIHYGGTWPANTYTGSDYVFENGSNFTDGFHVYSAVWEEDNIKWYVDGTCFFQATAEQWYSLGAQNNPNAPFDQEFYIIMNLALGGWFDSGLTPNLSDLPATMEVDYVRVYQEQGSSGGSYTDNSGGDNGGSDEDPADNPDEDLVNVAVNKPVTVSGVENVVFGGANLTDGDEGTRWSSDYADDAWFVIDLEESREIRQIVLLWETAYGTEYDLMVSADGTNWQTVAEEREGQGGRITYDFSEVNARYVKMQGIERAMIYGYSLWEVEVNGIEP